MNPITLQANVPESELYSANRKIILAQHDAAMADEFRDLQFITVYLIAPRDAQTLQLLPIKLSEEPFHTVSIPPTNCSHIFYSSSETKHVIETLSQWWTRSSPAPLPSIIKIMSGDKLAVWNALFSELGARELDLCRQLTQLQTQHSLMRECLQNANDLLALQSDYLSKVANPRPAVTLSYPRTDIAFFPPKGHKTFAVQQYLPVTSRGLAAIRLYFSSSSSSAAQGNMKVTVRTLEDRATIAAWEFPYSVITKEPRLFELPTPNVGYRRSVQLEVSWTSGTDGVPGLFLSSPAHFPRICANANGHLLSSPIALKVYSAPPSLVRNADAYLAADQQDTGQSLSQLFPPYVCSEGSVVSSERMSAARLVGDQAALSKDNLLTFIETDRSIQLHPTSTGVTVALIHAAVPVGVKSIVAQVRTAHPKASAIDYGFAVVTSGTAPKFDQRGFSGATGFSGWHTVIPGPSQSIPLELAKIPKKPCDIYLATKLPKRSSARYAWARWLSISILG